jgi:hypothetical protein
MMQAILPEFVDYPQPLHALTIGSPMIEYTSIIGPTIQFSIISGMLYQVAF